MEIAGSLRTGLIMSKCPYCFRTIGKLTHDPILVPDGAQEAFSDDVTLISVPIVANRFYKGFDNIHEIDVQQLQEELQILEVTNSISPLTIFSPLNINGKFQITGKHILELRQSVEKILTALSYTKQDYFNYDEDGNHISRPGGDKIDWTDPITSATDLTEFQIKNLHIEDLRHLPYNFNPNKNNQFFFLAAIPGGTFASLYTPGKIPISPAIEGWLNELTITPTHVYPGGGKCSHFIFDVTSGGTSIQGTKNTFINPIGQINNTGQYIFQLLAASNYGVVEYSYDDFKARWVLNRIPDLVTTFDFVPTLTLGSGDVHAILILDGTNGVKGTLQAENGSVQVEIKLYQTICIAGADLNQSITFQYINSPSSSGFVIDYFTDHHILVYVNAGSPTFVLPLHKTINPYISVSTNYIASIHNGSLDFVLPEIKCSITIARNTPDPLLSLYVQ